MLCSDFHRLNAQVDDLQGLRATIVHVVGACVLSKRRKNRTDARAADFASIGAGVLVILLLRYLPEMPGFRRLILDADVGKGTGIGVPANRESDDQSVLSGELAPVVGQSGLSETDLRPSGKVRVGNELLDVISTGDFIEVGEKVRIVELDGSRIVVEKIV